MYDSITAADIPANAEMVAGYVDGLYRWSDSDWARFPRAVKIRIAVFASTNDGHVLDVEPGNATPAQARGWILMRQAAGLTRPTIYCSRSDRAAVESACAGLAYDLWIAAYDLIIPTLLPGTVATQYVDPTYGSGGHYDKSLVRDDWYSSSGGIELTPTESETMQWLRTFLIAVNAADLEAAARAVNGPVGGTVRETYDLVYSGKDTATTPPRTAISVTEHAALSAKLDTLKAQIAALPAGQPVNFQPVLDAIAALPKPPTHLPDFWKYFSGETELKP
jgi:hypothetical protein